jgi:hypothetical protein
MAARYMITFTNSTGRRERQSLGESETVALLERLPKIGARSISVLAPNGDTWSGEEAMQRLSMP